MASPDSYDARALGALGDPASARLRELARRSRGSRELVQAVFEAEIFAPALSQETAFVDAVADLHATLVRGGHRAAIEAALG